ncbi:MAG TPA: CoA transferase [Myxococcota bacterium]|nr:CoA transferase [Myxococcota bacterium]
MSMLSGIRVVDFTQYLAGPTVTRLMAEMGADVVKVEQAPGGDPSRLLPLRIGERSIYFIQQNRGKKSVCLDFAKPEAAPLMQDLAAGADVVVENYGPGVLEKRGISYAALSKRNPKLVMASISAFGRTGPLAHKVGFDLIAQAFSGLMSMTGEPGRPPMWVGAAIADVQSGVHAFGAIGYALFHRERTGRGQHIDVSMVDALYHCHEGNVQAFANSGGQLEPSRHGAQHAWVGPMGVYKAAQGWIVLLVLERQWEGFCRALGRPELATDPRFATGAARGQNKVELTAIIEAWLAAQGTDEAALAIFEQHRVAAAPVLTVRDTVDHPYFKAREMVRSVPDPVLGQVTIPGFPFKFGEIAELPDLRAPLLGEHNVAVLRDRLGLDSGRIDALTRSGVLVSGNY